MSSVEFVTKNCPLWVWDRYQHDYVRYVFEPVDDIWGYIRQATSDKVWQPEGGPSQSREKGTKIVLHSDRGRWALFAIDLVQKQIIHRDGMFVHHMEGTNPYPPNFTPFNFYDLIHEGTKWTLVNPNNPSPKILGEWRCVFSVENPIASQSRTYGYKTGKSHDHSTNKAIEFNWKTSLSARNEFLSVAEADTSTSLTTQIASASSDTWSEESEVIDTIEVEPGKSVAVWQRVFIGEQFDHKAVYQSNIFEHTESIHIMPKD